MSNVNNRTGKLIACCGLRFVDRLTIISKFYNISRDCPASLCKVMYNSTKMNTSMAVINYRIYNVFY